MIGRRRTATGVEDAPAPEAPPPVEGRVEVVADGLVSGWAWRPEDPTERLTVGVLVDRHEVCASTADLPRKNLAEAGIGDGRHGFQVRLPEEVEDGRDHELLVQAGDPAIALPVAAGAGAAVEGKWRTTVLRPVTAFTRRARPEQPTPAPVAVEIPRSSHTAAVVGAEDWLFPLEDDVLERAGRPPSAADAAAQLSARLSTLTRNSDAFREIGVPYVFALAPLKRRLYSQFAPEGLVAGPSRRPAARLIAAVRDLDGCDLVDLLAVLRDGRRHGDLFGRTDCHWNARGAFVATRALLKEAAKHVPAIEPAPLESMGLVSNSRYRGDLADAPKVRCEDGALIALPADDEDRWTEEAEEIDAVPLRARRMPATAHLELPELPPVHLYEIPDSTLPRALLLGDAACAGLVPWLAERFRRFVYVPTTEPPFEVVELEMPDVVLHVELEH